MLAQCLCVWAALASATFAEARSAADGLTWEANLETAQRLARETNRLVLIHFGGPWCEPCQALEKQVFSRPGFGRELKSRFVAVKIDPRDHTDLATKYGVKSVPTDVVTTASGQMIYPVRSPTSVAAYIETMNRIADSVQPVGDVAGGLASAVQGTETPAHQVPTQGAPAKQTVPPSDPTDRYADYHRNRQVAGTKPLESEHARADQEPTRNPPHAAAVSMRPQIIDTSAASEPRQPAARPQPKTITPAARAPGNPPLALGGYCVVTLAQRGVPQAGDNRWGAIHRGHTYLFVSEEAQKIFLADPDRYAPALDGYCPVMLLGTREWHAGDMRWHAVHNGRTYLFASEEAQKAFLAGPDRYSPVLSGNDPVMRLDHNQDVAGKRKHGAFYNDRVYLFANEETLHRFESDPARYTIENRQALRR